MSTLDAALRDLSFGEVDSESETDLSEKFVQTDAFERLMHQGRADLIVGPKGSGKSALFGLLTRHEDAARSWAGKGLDGVVLQEAVGVRDLAQLAGGDLSAAFGPDADYERVWTGYIAW